MSYNYIDIGEARDRKQILVNQRGKDHLKGGESS